MWERLGSVRGQIEIKKNVLYVPKLNCNLVSISKLCKQLNCAVTFYDNSCVIQDRILKTPIEAGE